MFGHPRESVVYLPSNAGHQGARPRIPTTGLRHAVVASFIGQIGYSTETLPPEPPLSRHPLCSWITVVVLAIVRCAAAGETVDLVASFGGADAVPAEIELLDIDVGTADARPHLANGWARDQVNLKRGTTFVWGLGTGSVLHFKTDRARPIAIEFQCRPFQIDGRPQILTVRLNDREVDSLVLQRGWSSYGMMLPAEAVLVGENRLRFGYAYHRPAEPRQRTRPQAVAWDWIRLNGLTDDPPTVGEGELRLPAGSHVAYYLTRGQESHLTWQSSRTSGGEGGQIVVEVEGTRQKLAAKGPVDMPLAATERPARLVLRAPADAGDVTIVAPRVSDASGPKQRPNIVIYMVDTLRADHLGCYGYERPTSPRLDELAKEAVLFEHVIAQSPWTRPSVASLFTGLFPSTHQVNDRNHALPDEVTTLAETLRDQGYRTAAVITNGNVSRRFGFDQGFDRFLHLNENKARPTIHLPSAEVNETVFTWLRAPRRGQPLFLYVHTCDPHAPYAPQEPFRSQLAGADVDMGIGTVAWLSEHLHGGFDEQTRRELVSLYDAEIAQNDAAFGDLVDELRKLGLYDDSLITFVSDHGEEFLEHGALQHGRTLYAEMIDVPLVVKFPRSSGIAPGRVGGTAQHVDLLPTVLATLGLDAPPGIEGRSLLPLIAGRKPGDIRLHSSVDLELERAECVLRPPWKLIRKWTDGEPHTELFDLGSDPAEQSELSGSRPELVRTLLPALDRYLEGGPLRVEPLSVEIDEDLAARLRAVGYLQ